MVHTVTRKQQKVIGSDSQLDRTGQMESVIEHWLIQSVGVVREHWFIQSVGVVREHWFIQPNGK